MSIARNNVKSGDSNHLLDTVLTSTLSFKSDATSSAILCFSAEAVTTEDIKISSDGTSPIRYEQECNFSNY